MQTEKPKIEQTTSFKNKLDIGETINNAIEIYKKTVLTGGLGFLILFSILLFFAAVGLGFFINPEDLQETLKNFNPEKLSTKGQIIYFGSSILVNVLISPFIAGMLKMADDAHKNEEVSVSSIHFYINSPFFLDITLATFLITTTSVVSSVAIRMVLPGNIGLFISTIVSLSISILTIIAIPLIIFKNSNYLDALKNSLQAIGQNFFIVLLLLFVAGIFAMVGVFAFCIGLFFTIPFTYAMQYSIYKRLSD
jgi:hypothetical protein